GRLMDTLHLSESDAHYRMQKRSMDSGRRIVDVAREILEGREEEAAAQAEEGSK
ncbi:MAG: ANTAR domain-containing protein, partial [Clostridia bacterium]|nr:ANTAR domain-containing protein [Clostridia bacterium]